MATVDELMDQAQVFASAWSLVDGPFDTGSQLELAKAEKELLRELLTSTMGTLRDALDSPHDSASLELANNVLNWHSNLVKHLSNVEEGFKAGTTVLVTGTTKAGSPDVEPVSITLSEREGALMRLAFNAALNCFKTPPFILESRSIDK